MRCVPGGASTSTPPSAPPAAAAGRHPRVAVVVHDPRGVVRAWSGVPTSDARTSALQAGQSSCSQATAAPAGTPPVLADTVPVTVNNAPLVTVVAWVPLDDAEVRRMRATTGVAADIGLVEPRSLVRRPEVVASSGPYDRLTAALRMTGAGVSDGTADGRRFALRDAGAGSPYAVLAVAPASDVGLLRTLAALVVVGALVAAVLVRLLARRLTEPLADLTRTADRLGTGDLAARSTVTGRDEVGRLGTALDTMAARLESTVGELRGQARGAHPDVRPVRRGARPHPRPRRAARDRRRGCDRAAPTPSPVSP